MEEEETVPVTIYVFNTEEDEAAVVEKYNQALWPDTPAPPAYDAPLVTTQEQFFINDLEISPELERHMQNYVLACQQYTFNAMKHDVQKSKENWFHALFFNFNACDMNTDLNNAIDFILRKYEPLKEIPNAFQNWSYIRQVLKMVVLHENPIIKRFVLLSMIAQERELADAVQKLFATSRNRDSFAFCLPHLKALMNSTLDKPYTRCNITYLVEFFDYKAIRLCINQITPDRKEILEMHNRQMTVENDRKELPEKIADNPLPV